MTLQSLAMMIVENDKLIEKHAANAGMPDLKVVWNAFNGPPAAIDALLSGNIDIISTGMTAVVTLWAKTKGNIKVRGIAATAAVPSYLLTRNPNVKTIKDFSDADRIAVNAVKISYPAMLLQMAAAKEWGKKEASRLDRFTVAMQPADARLATRSTSCLPRAFVRQTNSMRRSPLRA